MGIGRKIGYGGGPRTAVATGVVGRTAQDGSGLPYASSWRVSATGALSNVGKSVPHSYAELALHYFGNTLPRPAIPQRRHRPVLSTASSKNLFGNLR